MAWTASVSTDPDKDDVGLATVTWNFGLEDEFVYQERVKISVASANVLKAKAIAAKADRDAKAVRDANLANTLTGIMNG